jgi:hypothetical protein
MHFLCTLQNPARLDKVLFPPFFDVLPELLPNSLSQSLLAFREEAVKPVTRIKVVSDNRPCRVDARGDGVLESCACVRGIERGDGAVRGAHEAGTTEYFPFRVLTPATNRPDSLTVLYVGRTP